MGSKTRHNKCDRFRLFRCLLLFQFACILLAFVLPLTLLLSHTSDCVELKTQFVVCDAQSGFMGVDQDSPIRLLPRLFPLPCLERTRPQVDVALPSVGSKGAMKLDHLSRIAEQETCSIA